MFSRYSFHLTVGTALFSQQVLSVEPLDAIFPHKGSTGVRQAFKDTPTKEAKRFSTNVAVIDIGFEEKAFEKERINSAISGGLGKNENNLLNTSFSPTLKNGNFNASIQPSGKREGHGTATAGLIYDLTKNTNFGFMKLEKNIVDDCKTIEKFYTRYSQCINFGLDFMHLIEIDKTYDFSQPSKISQTCINISMALDWDASIVRIMSLAKKGVFFTIAAGNENALVEDIYLPSQRCRLSECLAECKGNVVLVGATSVKGNTISPAWWTNYPVDTLAPYFIYAPGEDILVKQPSANRKVVLNRKKDGTSYSGPIYMGVAIRLSEIFGIHVSKASKALFESSDTLANHSPKLKFNQKSHFDFPLFEMDSYSFGKLDQYMHKPKKLSEFGVTSKIMNVESAWNLLVQKTGYDPIASLNQPRTLLDTKALKEEVDTFEESVELSINPFFLAINGKDDPRYKMLMGEKE